MRPVLYEINTRRWLRELAADAETPVTLDRVPESGFLEWTRLGFTHIWLMGVWKTGPLARAEALRAAAMRDQYARALENFTDADIEGSPYAIAEYAAAPEFGGTEALRVFRKRLNEYGLKLILDFVPNHVGLDHPWLRDRPDFFVQSASATAETFERETAQGRRWFAHGKDPYFPSWTDTAQLDYRRRATQAAMMDALSGIAALCDGVRCDMAMLVLNDVFAKTWARFPLSDPEPNFEFWELAIPAVKASRPGFVFLAEAYWGIEPRLQALGFDYTYDKELYDRLVANDPPGVQRHLLNHPLSDISAGAHFLENHDEARAASVFSFARHRAAAALILALPGMVLLHEGQLEGLMKRVPVQLVRAEEEPSQPEIQQMYEELLAAFAGREPGEGIPRLLRPGPLDATSSTWENLIVIQWGGIADHLHLAVVNLSENPAGGIVRLNLNETRWNVQCLYSSHRPGSRIASEPEGLRLEFQPCEVQHLRMERSEINASRALSPGAPSNRSGNGTRAEKGKMNYCI